MTDRSPQRARVVDEHPLHPRYFIQIERPHGSSAIGPLRFTTRRHAQLIVNRINEALEKEGRLYNRSDDT